MTAPAPLLKGITTDGDRTNSLDTVILLALEREDSRLLVKKDGRDRYMASYRWGDRRQMARRHGATAEEALRRLSHAIRHLARNGGPLDPDAAGPVAPDEQ